MARFPSIDETGAFEAPEVQSKIKELVTGTTDGITVDTSVGTRVYVGDTMIYGDTGWLDVRPLLINGWTAGLRVRLKRENNTVTFQAQGGADSLNGTDATSTRVFTIPAGFVPSLGKYGRVGTISGPGGSNTPVSLAEQDLAIPTGGAVMGEVSWHTSHDWPTES